MNSEMPSNSGNTISKSAMPVHIQSPLLDANPSHEVPPPMTPSVTIVVSPRERFSHTQPSLESIYTNTRYPFSLVYVDGGSPQPIQTYLKEQAGDRHFRLIRSERYLSPNQARNLGLMAVKTDYVVFIDNDVEVAPNWLTHLVNCANETQASVITPLTCIGKPIHQTIHLAGGEARLVLQTKGERFEKRVHEKHYFVNRLVADVQDQLDRRQCEFAEFHCMMVRLSTFERVGPLDEQLLSTREHIDFCLQVTHSDGSIYCEPASVVTYVPGLNYTLSDLGFFMLRWSDDWELRSLERFRQKWELNQQQKYFKKRFKRLGHRRHFAILKPLVRTLAFGRSAPWLERILIPLERMLNRWITHRYAHAANPQPIAPVSVPAVSNSAFCTGNPTPAFNTEGTSTVAKTSDRSAA